LHCFLSLFIHSLFASETREHKNMGSIEAAERTTVGLAAKDPSGILTPYTYTLR
jgi:hypothetical protein